MEAIKLPVKYYNVVTHVPILNLERTTEQHIEKQVNMLPKPEILLTDAQIDEHVRNLGETLKAKVRASKRAAYAKAIEDRARQKLNEAKDDLRELTTNLMGI